MLFYQAKKNGGAEYCSGEVESVNGNEAAVTFDGFSGLLRYRGANSFWDSNSRESCKLAGHCDVSGAESIALICPECESHHRHTCRSCPTPFTLGWQTGDRVFVGYSPQPGIVPGKFEGSVIRAVGRIARIYLDYGDGDYETVHVAHLPDGGWIDLDYGIPCDVTEAARP